MSVGTDRQREDAEEGLRAGGLSLDGGVKEEPWMGKRENELASS